MVGNLHFQSSSWHENPLDWIVKLILSSQTFFFVFFWVGQDWMGGAARQSNLDELSPVSSRWCPTLASRWQQKPDKTLCDTRKVRSSRVFVLFRSFDINWISLVGRLTEIVVFDCSQLCDDFLFVSNEWIKIDDPIPEISAIQTNKNTRY